MRRWRPPTRVPGLWFPGMRRVGRGRAETGSGAPSCASSIEIPACSSTRWLPASTVQSAASAAAVDEPRSLLVRASPEPRAASAASGRPRPSLAPRRTQWARRAQTTVKDERTREPHLGRRDRQGASWTGVEPAVGSRFPRGEDKIGVLSVRRVCVRALGIEMERAEWARAVALARPVGRCSGQALGCSSLRGWNGRIWMVVSAMLEGR